MTEAEHWRRVVEQIGQMPDVIERLLSEHRPDPAGLCVACTTPGRGTPRTPWPCSLFALAQAAETARSAEAGRRLLRCPEASDTDDR